MTGLVTNPFQLEDGAIRVPDLPGLGVQLDEEMIERYRVEVGYRR
ncbi:MAG TPA: hypothetical protein PKE40_12400 [Arachnia sp.]|nr:hypothetical protein [Arachnia sp.]HMT87144.1 hypothetical protein [Arachnia sp.]